MTSLSNRLITGDALEEMRKLPSESVHCVITSPPYNIGKLKAGSILGENSKTKALLDSNYADHDDSMPVAEYVEWQRECLREMWRLITPDGAIFYNHKPRPSKKGLEDLSREIVDIEGITLRNILIWNRLVRFAFSDYSFTGSYEWIYFMAKDDCVLTRQVGHQGEIWNIPPENDPSHPASFPVKLPAKALSAMSMDKGIVLDPFSGSGTTAIAAVRCRWSYIGIEKSAEYTAMAQKRLDKEPKVFL